MKLLIEKRNLCLVNRKHEEKWQEESNISVNLLNELNPHIKMHNFKNKKLKSIYIFELLLETHHKYSRKNGQK